MALGITIDRLQETLSLGGFVLVQASSRRLITEDHRNVSRASCNQIICNLSIGVLYGGLLVEQPLLKNYPRMNALNTEILCRSGR